MLDWVRATVRNQDKFSQTINFTYKGEDSFKTFLGGGVLIVITSAIWLYAVYLILIMVNRKDVSSSANLVSVDLNKETTAHNPQEQNVEFGIYWSGTTGDLTTDSTYINVIVNQVTTIFNPTTKVRTTTRKALNTIAGNVSFADGDTERYNTYQMNFVRGLNDAYVLSGNYYSTTYRYLEISVAPGSGSGSGESAANINAALANTNVELIIKNSYFDLEDFEKPIKTYYEDRHFLDLVSSSTVAGRLYVKPNEVELKDQYLYSEESVKKEFYSVSSFKQAIDEYDASTIAYFSVFLAPESQKYSRSVFSFLDLTGKLGGIWEIMMIAGSIFTGVFSSKLINYSLFSQIYQVDKSIKSEKKILPEPKKSDFQENKLEELSVNEEEKKEESKDDDSKIQMDKQKK